MKIRYRAGFAALLLVAAAFTLGTSFLTGASMNLFTGTICLVIGIAYLIRPVGELTPTALTLFALIGPLKKHYPFDQLRVVDGKLYCGDKKVRVAAWATNTADWRAVLERVRGRPN